MSSARAIGAQISAPSMTKEECVRRRKYAHNQRYRFTTGFYCEDCGTWVAVEDDAWYFTNCFGVRQEK